MGRGSRWIVAGVALAVTVAAACTPAPAGVVAPAAPVISAFLATPSTGPAPALLPFVWSVSDANGDDLTCALDLDGDDVDDLTIAHCQGVGSRNGSYPTVGSWVARLRVTDGHSDPVTATTGVSTTTDPTEPYDIELRPVAPLDPDVQAVFDTAKARWQAVLVRGVPDQTLSVAADACLSGAAAIEGVVDDLVIDISVTPIDGVGGVLGQAGPCVVAGVDSLTRVGSMEFDSADVASMMTQGIFGAVVIHEIGHVLGIGTLWNYGRSLLAGAGGSDPRYFGPRGVAEWAALGGTGGVPVENSGGPGTQDAHWREVTFGNEVMTGYVDYGVDPLSAMTVASLADLGYQVDITQADSYSPWGAPAMRIATPEVELHSDALPGPLIQA